MAVSACCSETDYDYAVERVEGSHRTCTNVCRDYVHHDSTEDLYYELRSCDDGVSEDGRSLAVCHVTYLDCVPNNHF